jgi:5-methylcytosine-specific restriction enzyme subunit McrC
VTYAIPIELREYEEQELAYDQLLPKDAERLWRHHGKQVAVEYPTPANDQLWRLTSQGWAGYLPVSTSLALRLQPKAPIENIFRMLEVAFGLKSFHLLDGLSDCRSLAEFFERLAHVLARRVLARSRKGLYRSYVNHEDRLAAVRGRIDLPKVTRAPWRTRLDCRFQEHTADVPDNRIVLWTLDRIRKNAACRRDEVRQAVRGAFHRLHGAVTLAPATAADCHGRTYTRLNDDYRALHALCRFFLETTGPTHHAGDRRNLPFLVNMASLFELYVAEWLRANLPAPRTVVAQKTVPLATEPALQFVIDLVLYDRPGGSPLAVLDTKYKNKPRPSTEDVAQVVAYAEAVGCAEAFLIYPEPLDKPLDATVGGIRVRTVAYDAAGDLEEAGRGLLERLGAVEAHCTRRNVTRFR